MLTELENMHVVFLSHFERQPVLREMPEFERLMSAYGELLVAARQKFGDAPVPVLVCCHCGNPDIEAQSWYEMNTGDPGDQSGDDLWCAECEAHVGYDEHTVAAKDRLAFMAEQREKASAYHTRAAEQPRTSILEPKL